MMTHARFEVCFYRKDRRDHAVSVPGRGLGLRDIEFIRKVLPNVSPDVVANEIEEFSTSVCISFSEEDLNSDWAKKLGLQNLFALRSKISVGLGEYVSLNVYTRPKVVWTQDDTGKLYWVWLEYEVQEKEIIEAWAKAGFPIRDWDASSTPRRANDEEQIEG